MIWSRLAVVLTTHTGRVIVDDGRRQTRRMMARARRRLRRGGVPALVSYAMWKKPPA